MDPLPNNAIAHFTYPRHPLEQLEANTEYVCGLCKTDGSGTRYRCNECAFDLHEYCHTCPESHSSFMHPHPLSRVGHNAQSTRQNKPVCHVCGDYVEGLFYQCEDCEFNLHPICTRLPQSLRHVLHLEHELTLQAEASSGLCAICRVSCCSWRYGCRACGFYIHLECILVPCVPPTLRSVPFGQPGPPPQCSIPLFGPSGPPPYGGSGQGMPFGYGSPGPLPYSGYGHEMPFGYCPPGPPPYCGYAHGIPFGYSPPWPPSYGYGMPSEYSPNNNGNHQTPTVGGTTNQIAGNMFRLVEQLLIGVASNAIFGLIS